LNPITAVDHKTMGVSLHEFVVKDDRPLGVEDFSITVCHERVTGSFPTKVVRREGLEGVWQLIKEIFEFP
jgi:hypothetical protein